VDNSFAGNSVYLVVEGQLSVMFTGGRIASNTKGVLHAEVDKPLLLGVLADNSISGHGTAPGLRVLHQAAGAGAGGDGDGDCDRAEG